MRQHWRMPYDGVLNSSRRRRFHTHANASHTCKRFTHSSNRVGRFFSFASNWMVVLLVAKRNIQIAHSRPFVRFSVLRYQWKYFFEPLLRPHFHQLLIPVSINCPSTHYREMPGEPFLGTGPKIWDAIRSKIWLFHGVIFYIRQMPITSRPLLTQALRFSFTTQTKHTASCRPEKWRQIVWGQPLPWPR